jgi:hypothetical protein
MMNNVDVRIRLSRHEPKFSLMSPPADGEYNVQIEKAILYVQKVNINPGVQLAVETMLRKQNAIYNLQRTDLKTFTIGQGNSTFTQEHISLGMSPKYAIVGLVDTAAMQGDYKKNPFNFEHFNLSQISMNVDGEEVPLGGINCDYKNGNYMEGYQSLLEVVGKWKSDNPMLFDREQYEKGYTLYGFQLVPELIAGAFNTVRNTNIRLDIRFAEPTKENITVLVWFSYDGALEIDANRDIYYDFSA